MEKIIILDFTTGDVLIIDYDTNKYDDAADFLVELRKQGILAASPANCEWMTSKNLKIRVL